jgi:hypothetical protein
MTDGFFRGKPTPSISVAARSHASTLGYGCRKYTVTIMGVTAAASITSTFFEEVLELPAVVVTMIVV